jgi:dolichol-phosphate mannosyltransferase
MASGVLPYGELRKMPELAVIVPTFNERENIVPMVDALRRVLASIDFEVIFVDDDSPDGTAEVVRSLSRTSPQVRIIQRINRRGLSSAAIEGMMASSAPYLAVIDGDMQHDESILPAMLSKLKADHLDLVIGTRNTAGGSMGSFSSSRVRLSNLGRRLSALVSHADISDPMAGYFVVSRAYLNEVVRSLSGIGFKVLLDLLASSSRPVRFAEVGYTFRTRSFGESKLTAGTCLEYVELILDKLIGSWIPVRYAFFGFVGAVGMLSQALLVYSFLYKLPLITSQAASSIAVMILNYLLNNRLTFRARRLRGWAWVSGLFSFVLACSIGLFCNLHIARALEQFGVAPFPSSLTGIFVGSVWNYGISSMLVWRVNRHYRRVSPAPQQACSEAQAAAV